MGPIRFPPRRHVYKAQVFLENLKKFDRNKVLCYRQHMEYRSPHGTGAAVDATTSRLERTPPDEQPYPPTVVPDPIAQGRDPVTKRIHTREAAQALARLPRRRDVLPEVLACHPDFERHYRHRLEWRDRRRGELLQIGRGVLSHGVGARLDRAAWLFAGSEFASELGAKTGELAMFTTAGNLAAQADRLDWSAYHLAVREAAGRPEGDNNGLPAGMTYVEVEAQPKKSAPKTRKQPVPEVPPEPELTKDEAREFDAKDVDDE